MLPRGPQNVCSLVTKLDGNPIGGKPERLVNYVKEDLARWKRVVEETGLKPE